MKAFKLFLCVVTTIALACTTITSCKPSKKSDKGEKSEDTTNTDITIEHNPINEQNIIKDTTTAQGVDLGLSVLWADRNVGASSPDAHGNYYAWGETSIKDDYSWLSYQHFSDSDNNGYPWKNDGEWDEDCTPEELSYLGENISKTIYDVAHTEWGENWAMPTYQQWEELINNCTWNITTKNGNNCYEITSNINGNSIILPIAGCRCDTTLHWEEAPFYWTSSFNQEMPNHAVGAYFEFYAAGHPYIGLWHRYLGCNVRPIHPK